MSSEIWNPGSSASAEQPPDDSEDSSVERPASLCLFARLPPEIWRQLIGLLSYSDVAACSCSTSHEDTKWLLIGYMKRRGCVSTFKRLLVEYGAITWDPDCGHIWDPNFWNEAQERKYFWRRAIEIIFLYERQNTHLPVLLLQEGQRYIDDVVQQDYIHSCGVLFASETCVANHQTLQRQFRASYGAPNHLAQPWLPDYFSQTSSVLQI